LALENDEEACLALALVETLLRNYPELASGDKIGAGAYTRSHFSST
jgi:hypothetical protein